MRLNQSVICAVYWLAVNKIASCNAMEEDWPSLISYSFATTGESKTLHGCKTTKCNFDDGVQEEDIFGELAVYADGQYGGDTCYPYSGYCSSQYLVEGGEVDSGAEKIPAYKVNPPQTVATQFVGSVTSLSFKFSAPLESSYAVYEFVPGIGDSPAKLSVLQDGINHDGDGNYVMTDVEVGELKEPKIYLVVPSSKYLGIWPAAESGATTIKAAVFSKATQGYALDLYAQLYAIPSGDPFNSATGWNENPDSHGHKYGFRKVYTRAFKKDGTEGVVWQDQSDWKIYVTWFTDGGDDNDTIELNNPGSHYLLAAASDGGKDGHVVYILIARTSAGDKVTPLAVEGKKVDGDGTEIASKVYDTASNALNVYQFFTSGGSLVWNMESDTLGWLISRQMTKGNDGLNHQGCIGLVLDASNLEVIANRGQTSGHSWNNFITTDGSNFLAVDLGDNYPRGVHVHKIAADSKKSKVVYTFKTKHGTTPNSYDGSPTYEEYTEISTDEVTFYKWSNDNAVYTEIAHPAAVEVDDGFMIFFAGERPALDNSKAVGNLNAPRNIGYVTVSKDLESIVSEGETATGGFYSFGGGWADQKNEGIVWLTDFTPDVTEKENFESALRIKTAHLEDLILLMYEVWSLEYIRTDVMAIDLSGEIVIKPTALPFPLRLSPADSVTIEDGKKIVFFGSDESKIIRFHLDVSPDDGGDGDGGDGDGDGGDGDGDGGDGEDGDGGDGDGDGDGDDGDGDESEDDGEGGFTELFTQVLTLIFFLCA